MQEQEPHGDRKWIASYQMLKDLTRFEDSIGIQFRHIRLLARAFTDRSIGFTHLTLGSNQRLEFLGDTVLQLICSEYLYRHFPEHHEGHLSLLRSSLVNNRTQAVVCDDLGMTEFAVFSNPKPDLKTKDRADLLEAFLGALYVDRGLDPCQVFCQVCLFPRLQVFIMNQDWNDPKSKLQQCCLTLRTMDGGEPDIPLYKVIECIGPTNTRVYTVAVYFRGKRLASATGHSIQQAEMNAAKAALENSRDLFPQLDHQKRVIAQSIKRQKHRDSSQPVYNITVEFGKGNNNNNKHQDDAWTSTCGGNRRGLASSAAIDDESNLPKQYRMREDISSDEFEDSESPDDGDGNGPRKAKTIHRKADASKRPRTEPTTLVESILEQQRLKTATENVSSDDDEEATESPMPSYKSPEARSRLSSCSSLASMSDGMKNGSTNVLVELAVSNDPLLGINKPRSVMSSCSSLPSLPSIEDLDDKKLDGISSSTDADDNDDADSVESGEIV